MVQKSEISTPTYYYSIILKLGTSLGFLFFYSNGWFGAIQVFQENKKNNKSRWQSLKSIISQSDATPDSDSQEMNKNK